MASRIFKQIIIVFIYLALLALIIFGLYFFFFRKERQPEDGNGQVLLQSIEVLETGGVQATEGYYDLVAKIKNPNQNHGAFSLPYQFKVYGQNSQLLTTKEGESFILPRSTKYLIEMKVPLSEPLASIKLVISESKWKEFKEFQPELFVYDKKFQLIDEPGVYAQASGILRNNSPFGLAEVKLDVVLKNSSRQIIGLNSHKVFTLNSGEERYFAARWFSPIKEEVLYLEIEPEFNVFLDDNFIRRYGILEKFQEF